MAAQEEAAKIDIPTAFATSGGNALPTCRYAAVLRPLKCHSSGKLWRRATIRTVRRGRPLTGKCPSGAASAIPSPSTPNFFHCSLARVGPKSGPPCFFEPPTMVGAMLFARLTHLRAPGQPFSAIKSCTVVPTVAPGIVGSGHSKLPKYFGFKPTSTNTRSQLRNAEVRCIKHLPFGFVSEAIKFSKKLSAVIGEFRRRKSRNVLEHDRSGFCFFNDPQRLGE